MKQLLALTGILLVAVAPQVSAFDDVSSSHPHATAIATIEADGIIQGYEDGTYRPDEHINRVEFLKVLLLSTDLTERPCTKRLFYYGDANPEAWYNSFLQTAGNCGIAQGNPDGMFRPEQPVNYAEASKMILAAKDLQNCPALTYTTYPPDGPWHTPYLICMDSLNGAPRAGIQAGDLITRGEMAQMIANLHSEEEMKEAPALEDELPPFGVVTTIYVGPEQVECTGVGPMTCLMVNGRYFYDTIEGFTHEEGFRYELKVEITNKGGSIPADSSSNTYTLVEILDQSPAPMAFLGLTEEAAMDLATEYDLSFRVVMRDGEPLPVTLDYRPGRINAEVEEGIVTDFTVEGELLPTEE